MPTRPKLPLKLYEKLGDDAMTELLTLFGDLGAETRAEFQALRREIAELRQDTTRQIADLREEMATLRTEINTKIAGVQSELIKWSFLFWLSTIAIVEFLIRFPR